MYQNKKRGRIRGDIERDHVLEVQVCNLAFDTMDGVKTRGQHNMLKEVINSVTNTNNTTNVINQKKKGPFVRWINNFDTGSNRHVKIESLARESCYQLVENGTWGRIEETMVASYDQCNDSLKLYDECTEKYMDHLHEMLDKMGIFDL